jgi:hypothetical protein
VRAAGTEFSFPIPLGFGLSLSFGLWNGTDESDHWEGHFVPTLSVILNANADLHRIAGAADCTYDRKVRRALCKLMCQNRIIKAV